MDRKSNLYGSILKTEELVNNKNQFVWNSACHGEAISQILRSYAFRNISFNVKKEQFFNVRVTMDWI